MAEDNAPPDPQTVPLENQFVCMIWAEGVVSSGDQEESEA